MANMSYCRFENTYRALMDCYYNINNSLSESENRYRSMLVSICEQILNEYDEECQVEDEDFNEEDNN
jgi:hypothetical protein